MMRIKISGADTINAFASRLTYTPFFISGLLQRHSHKKKFTKQNVKRSLPLREMLTETRIQEMFGENYKNILCYSFEKKHLNKNTYLNHSIINQEDIAQDAIKMKAALERVPDFQNTEIVAVVTMVVPSSVQLFFGNFIENPTFSKDGTAIVGNVICRNRKTGRIMPLADLWLAGRGYTEQKYAAIHGVADFVKDCWGLPGFCRSLASLNTYER